MKKCKFIMTHGLSVLCLFGSSLFSSMRGQDSLHVPTISEVISLKGGGNPQLSPDGKHVAYGLENMYGGKNGKLPF